LDARTAVIGQVRLMSKGQIYSKNDETRPQPIGRSWTRMSCP
jgi:hypothetical protein